MAPKSVPGPFFLAISGAASSLQHFLFNFKPKTDEKSKLFWMCVCDTACLFFKPANLENHGFSQVKR